MLDEASSIRHYSDDSHGLRAKTHCSTLSLERHTNRQAEVKVGGKHAQNSNKMRTGRANSRQERQSLRPGLATDKRQLVRLGQAIIPKGERKSCNMSSMCRLDRRCFANIMQIERNTKDVEPTQSCMHIRRSQRVT